MASFLLRSFSLLIAVATAGAAAPITLSLSEAHGFNLLTWGNASLINSDTEGRVAVGGNATFSSYSIGTHAGAGNPAQAAFVVGGNLSAGHGQVYNGSIFVGGSYSGPGYALNSAPGSTLSSGLGAGLPFDFGAAQAALTAKSTTYGAADATGSTLLQWSTLTLTGTGDDLNIFELSAAQLASASGLVIDVAQGSRVLVNVTGQAATFQNMGIFTSASANNILFNFHEATSLSLSGIGVIGSILAPHADVFFQSGQMNGQLVAKSFSGASWGVGELHHHPFNNDTPPPSVPDAAATGGLVGFALLGLGWLARRRR